MNTPDPIGGRYEVVVFGGGCFWCTEAVFLRLKGVISVTSGYAGGPSASSGQAPTYEQVSTGRTGHAEVIRVEYDPAVIPFRKLLEVFFASHDPTTPNRQGADVGTQYRSIILYTDYSQKIAAGRYVAELTAAKRYPDPIVTEIKLLDRFWPAEEYHRDFYAKNPDQSYSQAVIAPKVEKTAERFGALMKHGERA